MKYQSEILVPITLAKNVTEIKFKRNILVSLDCSGCKRSRRTVGLFENHENSFCTPTKHEFPGRIIKCQVSDRENTGFLSSKSIVTATYYIDYDFEQFIDKKYPTREIGPAPTWSRVTFLLTCKCGEKTVRTTQNNIGRPWKAECKCGKDLYYEIDQIPIFQNTAGEIENSMFSSFFPESVFSERLDLHQYTVAWYGKHLAAMKEPSLFKLSSDKDLCVYRFLWLRTFHNPIVVRLIVNNDGSAHLISKITSGAGGYEPGEVTESIEKIISAEEVDSIELALSGLDFWDLPSTVEDSELDGAQWIVEGVKDGKYHIVDRWSPDRLYEELALFLVKCAGIKVDEIY